MPTGTELQIRLETEDTFNAGPGATPTVYDLAVDAVSAGFDRTAETSAKMSGDTTTVFARLRRKTFAKTVEVEVGPSSAAAIRTMLTRVSGVLPSYAMHVWDGAAYFAAYGVKLNAAQFFVRNDELLCRLSFVGTGRIANESGTNAITAFSPFSYLGTNRPFELKHLVLTIAGDATYVRHGFEFDLQHNLTVGPPMTNDGWASQIVEGAQRVTGRAELEQQGIALLQACDDDTEIAVSAAFTKGADSITFALNSCLVSGIPPSISPTDTVKVTPTFTPSGATPWTITVV